MQNPVDTLKIRKFIHISLLAYVTRIPDDNFQISDLVIYNILGECNLKSFYLVLVVAGLAKILALAFRQHTSAFLRTARTVAQWVTHYFVS